MCELCISMHRGPDDADGFEGLQGTEHGHSAVIVDSKVDGNDEL